MMGLKEFKILFDEGQNVFTWGQELRGRVRMDLESQMDVTGLVIIFKGDGCVSWIEKRHVRHHRKGLKRKRIHYRSDHAYLYHVTYLIKGPKNGEFPVTSISPGEHEYEFRYELPRDLPSSFEGDYGYIRYVATAELQQSGNNHHSKGAFTVVAPVDLNTPQAERPLAGDASKMTGFLCCCRSGPLSIRVQLPASGYVCGQNVQMEVDLINDSNVNVKALTCSAFQDVTYFAKHPRSRTRKQTRLLFETNFGKVDANTAHKSEQTVVIPPCPPTHDKGNIKIEYFLEMEARLAGLHSKLTLSLPILVGTIPLNKFMRLKGKHLEAPSPAYEHSVFGGVNIREERDDESLFGDFDYIPYYCTLQI